MKNFKEILILLLISLVIGSFCYFRYTLYKNKKEKLRVISEQINSQSVEEINSTKSTLWSRIKGFAKEKVNINSDEDFNKKSSRENENAVIEFNVSSEYDSFIFDDSLFMFEGEQEGKIVKQVLDRMLETAIDDFYSNPSLTIKNLGNLDGTIVDDNNYISNINNVKDNIKETSKYKVSFGYNKLRTHANEVIIEKI